MRKKWKIYFEKITFSPDPTYPIHNNCWVLRIRPNLQTSEHCRLCGALKPQVRTPQVWPPVMSWSRTVDDRALSSFWWPPDKEMLSGVPLIGDPDASRINLTLSVFYFSLSFFLSLSNLWPRPQGIYSRNYKLFISLDLPDEGFTINRKLAGRCQLLIHTKSIPWCNFSSL